MFNFKPEQKRRMIEQIQIYFYEERGEELGEIAADRFLEFMSEELGSHFYNKGVEDAKSLVEQKMLNLDEDLMSLKRPIN